MTTIVIDGTAVVTVDPERRELAADRHAITIARL